MITFKTLALCVTALTWGLASGTALAQKPGQQALPGDQADQLLNTGKPSDPAQTVVGPTINDGEAYHRADDAEQNPAEVRTTQALNDEITARNQLAENQEQADQAAFEAERAKHEAVVAQATADQLAYEEVVRQSAAAQQRWQADRARWEADVRACQAGDRTRCAAPR